MIHEVYYSNPQLFNELNKVEHPLASLPEIMSRIGSPVWREGLNHGEIEGDGIFIELSLYFDEQPGKIVANSDIFARHKGDEALRQLQDILRKIAKASGKKVIHEGKPTNPAATALFKRHPEYKKVKGNNWVFEIVP